MFKDILRQGSDRLNQVLKTSVSCKVTDDRYTTFRTIPESVKYSDVPLVGAVFLPTGYPSFKNLSDLAVADGHFLDTVDFEGGSVQHLLNGAACRLEN